MIARIIHWSLAHRLLVLLAALALALAGLWSLTRTPLDALPDLSDTQVIIRTSWAGQSPQVVEDQLTYPLATTMMSVPGAQTVRGYSMFGDSFVYILFEDGTDLYWARSRVLEYLSQLQGQLPAGVSSALGPDATGLGWIYQYALIDRSGRNDIGQLTSLQNWFLRFQLKSVPGVAEVATLGGMERAWQIIADPQQILARGLTMDQLVTAVRAANGAVGGSVIEQGEAQMMVRSVGYLRDASDFAQVPVATAADGTPVLLGDVARIRRGPTLRQGLAELDGEGAVTGGIVIMRSDENAREVIHAVKAKLDSIRPSLPAGVEIVPTYDRSELIDASIANLRGKLTEEFVIVALACLLFLWHLRSALVAIIMLPLGILVAFIALRAQGVAADIMSLSGIAIAISAMVDAAIVMIENAHRHLERWRDAHGGEKLSSARRWQLIADATVEVGPALFTSLLVITCSFLPVFTLEAQEGRLFKPLAFTKTYAMAAAAALSVTLVPVLMGYFVRGHIRAEAANPVNRLLVRIYHPALDAVRRFPRATFTIAFLLLLSALVPLSRLGAEFMPAMDEGSLVYMPTALPGLSVGKAEELLQQTDRMLKTVPEVAHVFGKAGRADTATDPAPLEMFETTITFKPKSEWRPGMTMEKLRDELDAAVQIPGLTNLFVPPIRNRIDMLATGIQSPIGVRVLGPDTAVLEQVASEIETVARTVPGVGSALAERAASGRYVDVAVRPADAARYGLTQEAVQHIVATAIGGEPVAESIEGRERYPIVLRYPREVRDSVAALRQLPIAAPGGAQLQLSQLADVTVATGPVMLESENGQLATSVYIDPDGRALSAVVRDLQRAVADHVSLPPGYTIEWAGQFAFLAHAAQRLALVVPVTIAIIFALIFSVFRRLGETLLVMTSLPFALVGGLWLVWVLGQQMSIATVIGFIALGGVAAEFGIIMLLYLRQAWERALARNPDAGRDELDAAIHEGAGLRVRPLVMTMVVILVGLLPIMLSAGAGHEVMQRIAAPMVGGMLTAPLLSMLVLPEAFRLLIEWRLRRSRARRTN